METCEYWGSYTCYFYEIYGDMCCGYRCPSDWFDPNCDSLITVQDVGILVLTGAGCGFFGALTISFLVLTCRARQIRAANRRIMRANYVRV